MLVIDGPDHVGKTRLAEVLVERLNACGLPHVYQHLSLLPKCFHHVLDYKPLIQRNVVMDRLHMSRLAYGEVFPEQQVVPTSLEYAIIDAWLTLVGGVTVVVTADEEWLSEHFGAKDEMYDKGPILEVNRVYKRLIEEKKVNVDFTWETNDWEYGHETVFPDESGMFVHNIIEEYKRRRKALEDLFG